MQINPIDNKYRFRKGLYDNVGSTVDNVILILVILGVKLFSSSK